jgi:hypothetical protein
MNHLLSSTAVEKLEILIEEATRSTDEGVKRFIELAQGTDLHRETTPKFTGDFGLRDSVCAGLTGRFAVSVAQVSTSSNRIEGMFPSAMIPVVVVRGKSGKRAAFSKAV